MSSNTSLNQKRALVLGSGFVAKPTVDDLVANGVEVTIACRTLESAQKLAAGTNARAISLDVTNASALDKYVAATDVVVGLVPYVLLAHVIESAIRNKKNVVTTSYVSPPMKALHERAQEAGITVMNEIGLDPGIDHLYALSFIGKVKSQGGKIISFLSYCGGLPAPEDSGNPLGYKFSWSSRGVLLALRNEATYWEDGEIKHIKGPDLMATAKPYHIYPGFNFVAYPNRDSTEYRERYNIPEAQTIIRGTLRYDGFPQFVKVLVDIGFLSDEPRDFFQSAIPWNVALQKLVGASSPAEKDLVEAISKAAAFANEAERQRIIDGLRWIGVFSDKLITPRNNALDTLCATLEEKCQYADGERDLVILQHKFEVEDKDGKRNTVTSTLCEYGEPFGTNGYSAMAKLVGIPCAVAVKQVLTGQLAEKGILAPMYGKINDPLIKELKEKYGIKCIEKIVA